MPLKVDAALKKPFREQQEFFRQKLRLTSSRYDDIRLAAHDRAFIVAGANRAALVNDFANAIQTTIDEGKSIQWWRQNFGQIVNKHGWADWTGSDSPAGVAWRTKVIYQTNLRTSYAAGRWAQMTDPKVLKVLPWWVYRHNTVENPRQQHKRWNGLTLPAKHEWFLKHYPPNGFGCACEVDAISDRQLRAMGKTGPDAVPDDGTYTFIDGKTGESWEIPNGIQHGWDYAPGAGVDTSLRQLVQDRLISYPPAITQSLSRDVSRYINANDRPAQFAQRALKDASFDEAGWLGFVADYERVSAAAEMDLKGYLMLLPADAVRHVEKSHGHDGDDQRPATPEDYNQVWAALTEAESVEAGHPRHANRGLPTVVAWSRMGNERWRTVWEVRPGKRNQALALLSLTIKRAGKK